jgi:hypothetical protein
MDFVTAAKRLVENYGPVEAVKKTKKHKFKFIINRDTLRFEINNHKIIVFNALEKILTFDDRYDHFIVNAHRKMIVSTKSADYILYQQEEK